MGIYERDYTYLTSEEQSTWEHMKREEVVDNIGGLEVCKILFRDYPKVARHYMSLFPNHYLDIEDLKMMLNRAYFLKITTKSYIIRNQTNGRY